MQYDMESRRDFLKIFPGGIASLLAFSPLSRAFGSLLPTVGPRVRVPNPYVTIEGKPILIVVKGTDFSSMIAAGMKALGGWRRLIRDNHDLLLKPNMVYPQAYPTTSACDSITAIVRELSGATPGVIKVGDQGWLNPDEIYQYFNLNALVSQAGGVLVAFSSYRNVRRENWDNWRPDYQVYADVYDAPIIVNLCTLKRHFQAYLTCALKNHIGTITGPYGGGTRHFIHYNPYSPLNLEVAEVAGLVNPELQIVDARTLMTVYGPVWNPDTIYVNVNEIIICGDLVATDAYCSQLMQRYDPTFSAALIQPTLTRAVELGLGTDNLNQVKIIHVDSEYAGNSEPEREETLDESSVSNGFELFQNYPNPFNSSTIIHFTIPEESDVELKVYDMLGREIATLVHSALSGGTHSVAFDADGLSTGYYLYKISAGNFTMSKIMLLVK